MARYYLLEFLALQITSAALAMPVSHGASTDTRQDENSTGAAGQRAANEPDLKLGSDQNQMQNSSARLLFYGNNSLVQ